MAMMRIKMVWNVGSLLYVTLICFPSFIYGLPRNVEKRSFMDDFMGPSIRGLYSEGDDGSDLIRSFLPLSHRVSFQHTQNGDFYIHTPFEEEPVVKFLNEYQDPDCPNDSGVEFVPNPNPPRAPTRLTPIVTISNGVLTVKNPSEIKKEEQKIISTVTNTDDELSVKIPLISIIDDKESTDLATAVSKDTSTYVEDTKEFSHEVPPAIHNFDSTITQENTVINTNYNTDDDGNKKEYAEFPLGSHLISENTKLTTNVQTGLEPTDDEINPVIPIIPVETHTNNENIIKNIVQVVDFSKKHDTEDNDKEGWIQIPQLHYHPATTVENTNEVSESSNSVYTFSKNTIDSIPSLSEVHVVNSEFPTPPQASKDDDLPTPNFNNLEDLLNRTFLNNTTVVYARSIDPPPSMPNSLSYPPTFRFSENNYLTAPDPSNPPAPLSLQPNTLLIDDWLDMSKRMYNKLGPEDKRKVYEANKAVVTGKYKYDNDETSDVKMKLLKDKYLVADRVKDPVIDIRIKGDRKPATSTINNYFTLLNSLENDTKPDSELLTNEIKLGGRIGIPEDDKSNQKSVSSKSDARVSPILTDGISKEEKVPLTVVKDDLVKNMTTTPQNDLKISSPIEVTSEKPTLDNETATLLHNDSTTLPQRNSSLPLPFSNTDTKRSNKPDDLDNFERPVIPDDILAMFDPNFDDKDDSENEINSESKPSSSTVKTVAVPSTLPPIPSPPPPIPSSPPPPTTISHASLPKSPTVSSVPQFVPPHPSRPFNPNVSPELNRAAQSLWSSASSNIAPRPPVRRPAHRPPLPTANEILASIFSQIVEGVVRTAITETVKNYGGPVEREFIRRLGL